MIAGPSVFGFRLKLRVPQPVTKYCVTIAMRFDTNQNSASPLGKLIVKKPNKRGIIHSIMLFIDCCFGSDVGMVDIFCCTHIEAATRMAIIKYLSGCPRSSQRNFAFKGIAPII